MPNNFKLTGDYYVSKFGNDSWDGLTKDTPKRTLQAGINLLNTSGKTLIIGAGVYSENIGRVFPMSGTATYRADGEVIFQPATSGGDFYYYAGSPYNLTHYFYDITFRNYRYFQSYNYWGFIYYFNNCNFINTVINHEYSGANIETYFTACKFINSGIQSELVQGSYAGAIKQVLDKCILINYYQGFWTNGYLAGNSYSNNYFLNSTIRIPSTGVCNYNNIQSSNIIVNAASVVTSGVIQDTLGRYYDLSQAGSGGSGSLAEPYKRSDTNGRPFNFANHRIAYPTFNASSSAVDPKFNSLEDQDFTLQADSWHIGRASDGVSNIGGTKYAVARRAISDTFSGSSATVDPSLIFQYNNYIISGSQVTGSITSAPIAVNTATPKVIQKVTYNGLLAFNKDTGSASGSNQNVPDFDTFTSASGNAAANPDRLVYYMRHTTGSSIPVSDAGWDNGGLWTAGQYNVFEWNTKPSIDTSGVGNGSGSFNAAVSPTFIQATYVQMQVKLRNDYLL